MNQGLNKIKDLLATSNVEQILIPEIQRDYVWSVENIKKLLSSFEEDIKANHETASEVDDAFLSKLSAKQKEVYLRTLQEERVYSNIGFIYAYYDGQMLNRYFLIDGQQRITTIYLLLIALALRADKVDYFKRVYFSKDLPKVDYKVRETAQAFLRKFINYLLEGKDIEKIKEQYWYLNTYENDQTIQSLIENYSFLTQYIEDTSLTFDYVENEIELWYFDTNKSEQGEELYIYMNSRGESVQSNENVKALLLESRSDTEKNEWGLKWEQWQSFFWKNRGEKKNADDGFDEFLRWVKIMEKVQRERKLTQEAAAIYVKEIRANKKLSTEYLELETIEEYITALKKIVSFDGYDFFEKKWLSGNTFLIDYIRLFPVLLYLVKYPEAELFPIYRVGRFFKNISTQKDIAKNPDEQSVQVIRLMHSFLEKELIDVADFGQVGKEKFKVILNEEELFKFQLYRLPPESFTREEVEQIFWEVENFKLCNGRIEFVWKCLNSDDEFDLNLFKVYSIHFRALFEKPTDLLRRALLTFGDYTVRDGFSPSIWMHRYNFGDSREDWVKIIEKDIVNADTQKDGEEEVVMMLLDEFKDDLIRLTTEQYEARLIEMILSYEAIENNEENWEYYFVINPDVLEYCEAKRACVDDEKTYLLKGKKAKENRIMKIEDLVGA